MIRNKDKNYTKLLRTLIFKNFNYNAKIYDGKTCLRVGIYNRGLVRALENFKYEMKIPEIILFVLESNYKIKSCIRTSVKRNYKPVYRLVITNQTNILLFINSIGFRHPQKFKKSQKLLEIYKNVKPKAVRNEGHLKILNALLNNELTTNEIAKTLNLHRETVKEHLERLERKNIVKKRVVYFNRWGIIEKASCKKYLWRLVDGKELS